MEHFDLAAFYGGSATELYHTLGVHRTPDGWVFLSLIHISEPTRR